MTDKDRPNWGQCDEQDRGGQPDADEQVPRRSAEEPSHPLDRHTNTTVALGASQQLAISQGSATDPDH